MRISDWSSDVCSSDLFKGHTFEDVNGLQALIAQEYGVTVGGRKGNITLTSFDGCEKVQVQVADLIEFGPELQAAKALVDECLSEWSADSRVELRALVSRVFNVDKEGQINRAELFMLLRFEIADERWRSEEHTSELQSLMRHSYAV